MKTAGASTFTLSQCDKSGFSREKQLQYSYGNCRLILARSKDGTTKDLQYVAGTTGKPNRDLHLEVEYLQPGNYFLFSEIDWSQDFERTFVLSAYGRAGVRFEGDEASLELRERLLGDIFKSKALQGGPGIKRVDFLKENAPAIVKYTDLSAKDGYVYIHYQNGELKQDFTEQITFTKYQGCQMLLPTKLEDLQCEIAVKPKSDAMLLVRVDANWGMSYKSATLIEAV